MNENEEKDRVHVNNKEEVKGVWKGHFEHLIYEDTAGKATMSNAGMEAGVCAERDW